MRRALLLLRRDGRLVEGWCGRLPPKLRAAVLAFILRPTKAEEGRGVKAAVLVRLEDTAMAAARE
jgi:hypothetical protein